MDVKLKECPFCGEKATITLDKVNHNTRVTVGCKSNYCFCHVSYTFYGLPSDMESLNYHKKLLIEKWNTRKGKKEI